MIRKAANQDTESIKLLGKKLMPNFTNTYNIDSYINDESYIILVNDEEFINAFLIVKKNLDDFEIEFIIVEEENRKLGIATKMLEYFMNIYPKPNSSIFLEVNINNSEAIKLYKKFDFEIINVRKKYYANEDAYVMKRVV